MKKNLLIFVMAMFSIAKVNAQCVFTCSNYAVYPITFTTFPSAGTNAIPQFSPNTDDGITPLISLGFNFNFYCTTYSQVWICSNGFLQFNNGVPAISTGFSDPTQAFPTAVAPDALVALNMNDLDAGVGGAITYTTLGVAPNRMFVLTFDNIQVFGYPTSTNTGQIVLYETSNIIEIYTNSVINNGITTGTQGIENENGTLGVTTPGRNNIIWSGGADAYRFAPYQTTPPSAISGTNTLCSGTSATYSVTGNPGALSYSWTAPSGWLGNSTTNIFTATSGISGPIEVSTNYTCGTSGSSILNITALPAPTVAIAASVPVICSGQTLNISAQGAVTYTLEPGTVTGGTPFVLSPGISSTYTLYGTDANGCTSLNNPHTMITVNNTPTVTVNSGSVCAGKSFTIMPNGADSYAFSTTFSTVTQSADGVYSYSVVGTNTNGCVGQTAISTLTVAANPTVSISASGNRATICKGEHALITAQGADTYEWVNGPSTASYNVSPVITTVYTVTGTNTDGCLKNSAFTVNVQECTGIEELGANAGKFMSVYPNPSNGSFHITAAQAATVEIYDLQGRLILKQNVEAGEHALQMQEANAGQYFLRATGDNTSHSVILIRE